MKWDAQGALIELQRKLGYTFNEPSFIENALIHRSYVHEHPDQGIESNERLEFLGDAVLDLAVTHLLMESYPREPEGVLSRWRAALVNERSLAEKARSLDLGALLKLGRGEEVTRGREKDSLLADAYEALLGAIYLDGGFGGALQVVRRHFQDAIKDMRRVNDYLDFKTRLQEVSQARFRLTPRYMLLREEGPDHDKTFYVKVEIHGGLEGFGTGRTKKEAEQSAARELLGRILVGEGEG